MESPHHKLALPLEGMRILLVEDDFFIRIDLQSILTDAGAEIAGSCANVQDALDALGASSPDAAILDVRLSYETVTPVARELELRGVPFIFYTGQIGTEATLVDWPGCKVLAKPAQPKAIVAAVAECCSKPA